MSPRIRPGTYPTAIRGVPFIDCRDLGPHSYCLNWAERNGIVYTCRAGHIDIAHVRKAADWTGYLAARTLDCLRQGQCSFQFKLYEPSVYTVELTYPARWGELNETQRQCVARDISRELGRYLAWTALTWHEILTGFGFRPRGYKSEFASAFSWEDSYSNLLGTQVAACALQDEQQSFSKAMTVALARQLETLGPQPGPVAKEASEAMRGRWFSKRWLFTEIRKRNFDVGLDDGYITPCLVPSRPTCPDARPEPLPVPTLDFLAGSGFTARVEIEAKVWEEGKIFDVVRSAGGERPKTIKPDIHFGPLIRHLEEMITDLYGPDEDGEKGQLKNAEVSRCEPAAADPPSAENISTAPCARKLARNGGDDRPSKGPSFGAARSRNVTTSNG